MEFGPLPGSDSGGYSRPNWWEKGEFSFEMKREQETKRLKTEKKEKAFNKSFIINSGIAGEREETTQNTSS